MANEIRTAAKLALRLTSTAYDADIDMLIAAGKRDLQIAGIQLPTSPENDNLIVLALVTFVRLRFGSPDDYDRLKVAYDEQKAQLQTCSDYAEAPESGGWL